MSRATPLECRSAFTLIELLIALVLAVLATGLALTILVGQQRLSLGLEAVTSVRGRVRDGRDVLIAALRTADAGDTIRLGADTAVEFFATTGASTVCVPPAETTLVLPPDTLAAGNTLTSWTDSPDTGDVVLVFHDSSALAPAGWERFRIASVTTPLAATVCPPSSGFTTSGDVAAGVRAYAVTLASSPSVPIRAGAPVRVTRRGRYSVYRSGTDGRWYLGYRRCNAVGGGCGSVQPVSGPYSGGRGIFPLSFRYYQSDGSELSGIGPSTSVARVDIVIRSTSGEATRLPGFPQVPFSDSSIATVVVQSR